MLLLVTNNNAPGFTKEYIFLCMLFCFPCKICTQYIKYVYICMYIYVSEGKRALDMQH